MLEEDVVYVDPDGWAFANLITEAWEEYRTTCNIIRNKYPPKDSSCGRFVVFSHEYELASFEALQKKDFRIHSGIKRLPPQ